MSSVNFDLGPRPGEARIIVPSEQLGIKLERANMDNEESLERIASEERDSTWDNFYPANLAKYQDLRTSVHETFAQTREVSVSL